MKFVQSKHQNNPEMMYYQSVDDNRVGFSKPEGELFTMLEHGNVLILDGDCEDAYLDAAWLKVYGIDIPDGVTAFEWLMKMGISHVYEKVNGKIVGCYC